MTVLTLIVLAPLQDFTEPLPTSSAALPILIPGLMADAALHLGTCLAEGAGVQ